jgi:hypothetical protein
LNRALGSALLLGILATACAGLAGGASGHRVEVRLYDAEDGVRLELANDTHPELRDVYSQRKADASLKLAPEEAMDALIESLELAGFERLAVSGPPPVAADAVPLGLRGWLAVSADGEQRTFRMPASRPTAEQVQAYNRMKLMFVDTYGRVGGLQYIQNPQGHQLFEKRP